MASPAPGPHTTPTPGLHLSRPLVHTPKTPLFPPLFTPMFTPTPTWFTPVIHPIQAHPTPVLPQPVVHTHYTHLYPSPVHDPVHTYPQSCSHLTPYSHLTQPGSHLPPNMATPTPNPVHSYPHTVSQCTEIGASVPGPGSVPQSGPHKQARDRC